jgi:hypothetical protein
VRRGIRLAEPAQFLVREEDAARARELLQDLEPGQPDGDESE